MVIPSCVYRLLAHNEKPTETLTARDPSAKVTVFGHVRGRAKKTQFISTSASLKACKVFLKKAKAKKNRKYIIVEINLVELCKMRKDINIIDLTDNAVLNKHISANPNSPTRGYRYNVRKWATDTEEILLHVCEIPSMYMNVVIPDSHSMNSGHDCVKSDDESNSENCSSDDSDDEDDEDDLNEIDKDCNFYDLSEHDQDVMIDYQARHCGDYEPCSESDNEDNYSDYEPDYDSYNENNCSDYEPDYDSYNENNCSDYEPDYDSYNEDNCDDYEPDYDSYNENNCSDYEPDYDSYNEDNCDDYEPDYDSYNENNCSDYEQDIDSYNEDNRDDYE
ncbi:uncharacterized protein PFA0635c-like [Mya arenaria]|uniref:uncharacterized protein PFA0635c-like n=1 Tax=Mya arenaria TaxID=6604 RepID=UPI0022E4129A|nr:uncharacterized protein PFA0635c-like [Mya arenaria]